jgi:hypothetical protein
MFPQTATLRRVTGAHNSDGTPVYDASGTIAVRWEEGTVRSVSDGAEVSVGRTRTVFTASAVGVGDEITYDGHAYRVAGITTIPTLTGAVRFYEVVLE